MAIRVGVITTLLPFRRLLSLLQLNLPQHGRRGGGAGGVITLTTPALNVDLGFFFLVTSLEGNQTTLALILGGVLGAVGFSPSCPEGGSVCLSLPINKALFAAGAGEQTWRYSIFTRRLKAKRSTSRGALDGGAAVPQLAPVRPPPSG